jgi:hypothetical protein
MSRIEGVLAGSATAAGPVPGRIDVAVNAGMLEAIQEVVEEDDVTLTEAVRRLIAYGQVVHRVARERSSVLLVRDRQGNEREVVVL